MNEKHQKYQENLNENISEGMRNWSSRNYRRLVKKAQKKSEVKP
ncbi:hypothetical protein [Serratia fonticola]|nr:hypothetical protein [Serratia fonticola]